MDEGTNMNTEIEIESELSNKFTSILDMRRIRRKEEDEANIEWSRPEIPDKSAIESRMNNIIENLKKQFKEEKFARRQAPKVKSSYKAFCNSVDAFLRHQENPKVSVKYSVDTPSQTSPVHEESLDDNDDDDDADAAAADDDDGKQAKHKEYEILISQMQSNVISRDSKTIHCSEISSFSTSHLSGEPTLKKLITQTKADDIKPMQSLLQKRHTSNAYFFSLKQKKLINGCLLPYLLAPSPFIGLNRKQIYKEFYGVKFKPAELSVLMSQPKYKFGDHNSKWEHVPVNRCRETTQKSVTKRPMTLDTKTSKASDFKRIFSLALRYNKVPRTRTLSIFGLYFTPKLYFGKEGVMPWVPLAATTTDMDMITILSYLNTKHPDVKDLDSYKLKPVKHVDLFENDCFGNVAITSSHLNTKYPAVKVLDSHKLKPAKHDDTPGKVFFDNVETMEKNDSKQVEVQTEELEVIIDDDDDDSPFGILSVYCRSGIHSR